MARIADLRRIVADFNDGHRQYVAIMDALPFAPSDAADPDVQSSLIAEAVFLRYFTLWEKSIGGAFLYFCQGGKTLTRKKPVCRLANCDLAQAKQILTGGKKYLDWSDQNMVRDRAALIFEDGFPFRDPVIGQSQMLSDCERVRNLIAHDTLEAWNAYLNVQILVFKTERTFTCPAGQLLRIRRNRASGSWGKHWFNEVARVFNAIANG